MPPASLAVPASPALLAAHKKAPLENGHTGRAAGTPASLNECLNLDDIETLATKVIDKKAWAYYCSAAETSSPND
jgi:hypothetical protein